VETDRQTDRQTERERERERQTDRQTDRERERERERELCYIRTSRSVLSSAVNTFGPFSPATSPRHRTA
jgi:hypothetical protein